MKKLLSIGVLMLVILVGVVMSGCGSSGNGLPELDSSTALTIRQDYVDTSPRGSNVDSVDNVHIHRYYGTFNGAIAVSIDDGFNLMVDIWGGTETIAGRTFDYSQPGLQILVWRDGVFYTLTEAYNQNLLTSGNIQTIWDTFQGQTKR